MQENQQNIRPCEEDEIDLKELFNTLVKNKIKIAVVTSIITIGAIIYAYSIPKVYEVKSNVQLGFINSDLIAEPDTLVKILNLVFNVEDKTIKKDKFISEVTSITTNKNLKNFIEIKTQAISNEEALKKNEEVVKYIQGSYQTKIEQYIIDTKNNIKNLERDISNIDDFEIENIKKQIELLKTQKIVDIDAKINRLREQDIKQIEQQIELLKTQKIPKLDEKIKFYKTAKLPAIESKIDFHKQKLKEYTKAVENLYKNNINNQDTTLLSISSMQMVNYQNLILNSQSKIEDLKIEKEIIEKGTIPDIEREKRNISEFIIPDMSIKINNIIKIEIEDLENEKDNIKSDTIKNLEYIMRIDLSNKKNNLALEIDRFKYKMTSQNIQNSKVVGDYIVKDYPIKPKKKLIVVVAFVTGLILSIFLVFFMEFIKGFKEEETPSER